MPLLEPGEPAALLHIFTPSNQSLSQFNSSQAQGNKHTTGEFTVLSDVESHEASGHLGI